MNETKKKKRVSSLKDTNWNSSTPKHCELHLLLILQYCSLFIFFIFIISIYHFYLSLLYFHHHSYSSFHSFILSFSLIILLLSFHFTSFFITTQTQCSQCSISFQWFTYHSCSWISNFVPCSCWPFQIQFFCWNCIFFQ